MAVEQRVEHAAVDDSVSYGQQRGQQDETYAPNERHGQHAHRIGERRHPQRGDNVLKAEHAAEQQSEGRRAETDGNGERRILSEASAQEDAGENHDGALADIAEHHAEHQYER